MTEFERFTALVDDYDFSYIKDYMSGIDWVWFMPELNGEGWDYRTPEISEMRALVKDMFHSVSGSASETGGFRVEKNKNGKYSISFGRNHHCPVYMLSEERLSPEEIAALHAAGQKSDEEEWEEENVKGNWEDQISLF
jgi:hypothetical protein